MGPYYFERCVSGCEANLEFTGLSFAELTLAHPNQSNTAFAWERCLKGIAFFRTHGSPAVPVAARSEEHTSELQSHSFISYAVFCFKNILSSTCRKIPPTPCKHTASPLDTDSR